LTIQHVRVEGTSYQRGLTAGQFWLAAGNPCQVPYEQLTVKL
jgi:hypothetical protein